MARMGPDRTASGGRPDVAAAVDLVKQYERVSTSLLQRRLGLSLDEATECLERLRIDGHLGDFDGQTWTVIAPLPLQLDKLDGRFSNSSRLERFASFVTVFVLVAAVAMGIYWVATEGLRHSPRVSDATAGSDDSGCLNAFLDASDGSVEGNEIYDLDPALRMCPSLSAWSAAFGRFHGIQAGDDPRGVAENRCMTGMFNDTPICRELGITP